MLKTLTKFYKLYGPNLLPVFPEEITSIFTEPNKRCKSCYLFATDPVRYVTQLNHDILELQQIKHKSLLLFRGSLQQLHDFISTDLSHKEKWESDDFGSQIGSLFSNNNVHNCSIMIDVNTKHATYRYITAPLIGGALNEEHSSFVHEYSNQLMIKQVKSEILSATNRFFEDVLHKLGNKQVVSLSITATMMPCSCDSKVIYYNNLGNDFVYKVGSENWIVLNDYGLGLFHNPHDYYNVSFEPGIGCHPNLHKSESKARNLVSLAKYDKSITQILK